MAKRPKGFRSTFDVEVVKSYARGRWPSIISQVGNIAVDLLDGSHHPCPKCGGNDRFRLIDAEAGAVLCNQCFRTGNGDGFAALEWLTGKKFGQVLGDVAELLGVAPEKGANGKTTGKSKADPAEHLEFVEWNDLLVGTWCLSKPPITPASIQAVGGKLARYRGNYTVIAIPVYGENLTERPPVGWCLYNITGGPLPKFSKGADGQQQVKWVKVKLTYGSGQGVIGDLSRLSSARSMVKVEGPSDLLAMLSLCDLPVDVAVITNANGAGEKPLDWICQLTAGKPASVVHDCDEPGQRGSIGHTDTKGQHHTGWAEAMAKYATECRNVVLPFTIAKDHGADLRDWIKDGGTWSKLESLRNSAGVIQSVEQQIKTIEADDDPHRLARVNLERYAERGGRTIRYWRDEWYVWKQTHYRKITEKELRAKIAHSCKTEFDRVCIERIKSGIDEEPQPAKKVTVGLVTNVLQATAGMTILPPVIEPMTWLPTRERRNLLAFQNGIIDLDAVMQDRDDYQVSHSPDWFSTICLPYEFSIDAECLCWEAFLERNLELDPERIKLLQEWAGYLLLPDTGMQRFLVLEGEGANGKSVYCAAIEAMLGPKNCSSVPLELFGDKFELTPTLDRLVNICGDAGELDKVAEGHIKSFTSGNTMSFGRKYLDPIERVPTARLMMAVNNRPRFSDRSDGVWRRMLLVPWRIQIPAQDRIPNMDKAAWWIKSGEVPGILLWALKGLQRLRQQGQFTKSELCDKALDDYRSEMNPSRRFLDDHIQEQNDSKIRCSHLYEWYVRWCRENGHHPFAEQAFGREVKRVFRNCSRLREMKNGTRFYFYDGICFSTEKICGEDVDSTRGLF